VTTGDCKNFFNKLLTTPEGGVPKYLSKLGLQRTFVEGTIHLVILVNIKVVR